jgi:hypothetical protein
LPDRPALHYVHDSFIAHDRVYLANWLVGVVVLDRARLEAGDSQEGVIIKPVDGVAPGGFHVHYVAPVGNGDFLFTQDELNADNGLRLLDVREPERPRSAWIETLPGGVNAPHNFVVDEERVYVGWYNDGVRVYRYDVRDPDNPVVEPVAFQEVRSDKNVGRERYFDGVWGVRVHECTVGGQARTCVYASDMSAGLFILALP